MGAAILTGTTREMLFRFRAFRVRSAELSPGIALRTAHSAEISCRRGIFPGNLPLRTHPWSELCCGAFRVKRISCMTVMWPGEGGNFGL